MIAGVVALIVFGTIAYFAIGLGGINGVKGAVLIMANVYSMLVLVVLLAYGLFNLPVFLWKYADNKHSLYYELESAEDIRKQYRAALVDFHTHVSQCKNLALNHRTAKNSEALDILMNEMPDKDLEGQSISHSSYFKIEIKINQEVTEDIIANVRYQFKVAYFMYKRKKSKWITLFNNVDQLVEKPIIYEDKHFKDTINKELDNIALNDLALKSKPNSMIKLILFRLLAVLSLIFCLLVIETEATVIIDPTKTVLYYVFIFFLILLDCH